MSAVAAEETMLCAELWLSFGSLIRAYAAAASVNAGSAPEIEATDKTIRVAAGAARLVMNCDHEAGAGSWLLRRGESIVTQGSLALLPEGRVVLDGKVLELDHAAIDLVASLMNASANPARDER